MSNCPFCNPEPEANDTPPDPGAGNQRTGLLRRAWQGLQWLCPATTLVLMPKYPMCIVAYVALFTGIGITSGTARWIQILTLALCLIWLAYLGTKLMIYFFQRSVHVYRPRHA